MQQQDYDLHLSLHPHLRETDHCNKFIPVLWEQLKAILVNIDILPKV